MSKLTKEFIQTGAYRCALDNVELHPLWSQAQLDASLQATLAEQPVNNEIWLFAYGSLLWNPLLDFAESSRATLHDWHRSFCIHLVLSRASVENPGRMLALEPGGRTEGVAYRLRPESVDDDLAVIWAREMIGGVYVPTWTEVILDSGRKVKAIAFVADSAHPLYEPDSSLRAIVGPIQSATGPIGDNAAYVHMLHASLAQHGLEDAYITDLVTALLPKLPCQTT
ncbi:gamma-glutamylcyclotransferase [Paraburkholderia bannensis]|uniref:gamma-glutamylcyclotransferase n=1 Tax=Paraburkholderia bannensis TaxID=765414 RepID=UPI002ABD7505|nr:gamma-glutamylcyclotransferase [Paraburkholderia bannensis]